MGGVTLVIPSHRRGRLILKTLDSVAAQTRHPDQVVIVNDGGDIETERIVKEVYPTYDVVNIPQSGAATARNRGAEIAAHDILMFLDDDDALRPGAVEVLVANLMRFPEAAASFGDHTFTDLDTGEHRPNHFSFLAWYERFRRTPGIRVDQNATLYGRALYIALLKGNLLGQPWVVKRNVYQAIGGFQSGLGSADDWDVYLRLLRRYRVVITPEIVSDHFREPGRTHLTTEKHQFAKQMSVISMELKRAGLSDLRAQLILRRRMGMYYKSIGDSIVADGATSAFNAYARSALWWPFDHVVVARALMWPLTKVIRNTV
jgi:glycosyltransferase involved in cell wall biosynthesis